jgi:transposase
MNTQITRSKWTEESISYLTIAYLQGAPLKQIAFQLDRSVSAINKVLARYKLRTHNKMDHLPFMSRPTPSQLQKKRNLEAQIRKKNRERKSNIRPDYREWVHFERVINWLKAQDISILKSQVNDYYEIEGYPKNKAQILYIANLRREQLHLPIFFVKGVTHW